MVLRLHHHHSSVRCMRGKEELAHGFAAWRQDVADYYDLPASPQTGCFEPMMIISDSSRGISLHLPHRPSASPCPLASCHQPSIEHVHFPNSLPLLPASAHCFKSIPFGGSNQRFLSLMQAGPTQELMVQGPLFCWIAQGFFSFLSVDFLDSTRLFPFFLFFFFVDFPGATAMHDPHKRERSAGRMTEYKPTTHGLPSLGWANPCRHAVYLSVAPPINPRDSFSILF